MNRSHRKRADADPLVRAYLKDLEGALAGTDPTDRTETLDAIREHIAAALDEGSTTVSQVIEELGPAERVAAAAGAPLDESRGAGAAGGWAGSSVLLAAAISSWVLVVAAPWITVVMNTIVLGTALYRLRTDRRSDKVLGAAVVIAVLGITVALVFALLLLETSSTVTPEGPGPFPGVPD